MTDAMDDGVLADACPLAREAAEDVALMGKVRHGDMAAFQTLVERHQGRVIGTVAKMLGDDIEAEDIAQRVFVRVWKSAPRYQPSAKFTTWLLTITRNLVFNELRRRSRHPADSMDEPDSEWTRQYADDSTISPSQEMVCSELSDAIESAIAQLPKPQRLALILRRYEEMPYEEIGKVLGCSVPAVKSLLFRARTELRRLLASHLK